MYEVKDLLHSCRKQLANRGSTPSGDGTEAFSPRSPLISVFWPGTSVDGREAVEQAIEDLWPIHAVKMHGIGGTVDAQELFNRIKSTSSGLRNGDGEFSFTDNQKQIVVHYLSTDSDELDTQLESICKIADQRPFGVNEQYIILVLLCNHDKNPKQAHRGVMLAVQSTKKIERCCCIFLSNVLQGGAVLPDERVAENYRIAANCCALANDAKAADRLAWMMAAENKLITASYCIVQKPTNEMSKTILRNIINRRAEQAEQNEREMTDGVMVNEVSFCKHFSGGIECVEQEFEKLLGSLPKVDDLKFLPGWKKACKEASFEGADAQTDGFLQLFFKRNYLDRAAEWVEQKQKTICEAFEAELYDLFDYKYIENHFERCKDFLEKISPAGVNTVNGDGLAMQKEALVRTKQAFYNTLLPALQAAMERMRTASHGFGSILNGVRTSCNIGRVDYDPCEAPVHRFYSENLAGFLEKLPLDKDIPVCENASEVLGAVENVFRKLINERKDLCLTTFEQELNQRLTKGDEVSLVDHVVKMLSEAKLDKEPRMVLIRENAGEKYCLVSKAASFANKVREKDSLGTHIEVPWVDRAERLLMFSFGEGDITEP